MPVSTCSVCGKLYDFASEEAANEPDRSCGPCYKQRLDDWQVIDQIRDQFPDGTTDDDVCRWYDNLLSYGRNNFPTRGHPTGTWLPLFFGGEWLGEQVAAAGGDDRERHAACFAFGQMCCSAENRGIFDPWKIARHCLMRFQSGNPVVPGTQLAVQLFREELGLQKAEIV